MKGTGISKMGPPCTDMKSSMSLCKNYVWRKLRCLPNSVKSNPCLGHAGPNKYLESTGMSPPNSLIPWSSGCNGREEESTVHISLAAHNSWGEFLHNRNNERREPHTDLAEKGPLYAAFFLSTHYCNSKKLSAILLPEVQNYKWWHQANLCEQLKREFIIRQIAQNTPNICYTWTERKRIVPLSTAWNILAEIRIMTVKTCQQHLEFSVFHCIYFPISLQIQVISSMTGDRIGIYKCQKLLCALIISEIVYKLCIA